MMDGAGKTVETDPREWEFASDALKLVKSVTKSSEKAIELLRKNLATGVIKARCTRMIVEYDFNNIEISIPKKGGKKRVIYVLETGGSVTALLWACKRRSRYERRLHKWDKNIFGYIANRGKLTRDTGNGRPVIIPGQRWVYYGVHLNTADVVAAVEAEFPGQFEFKKIEKRKLGNPPLRKWYRLDPLYQKADQGRLGDVEGVVGGDGWNAAMTRQINRLYADDPEWTEPKGTIQRMIKDLRARHEKASKILGQ